MLTRFIDLVKNPAVRPMWRDSLDSFFTVTKLSDKKDSLAHRTAVIIDKDRGELEKSVCSFIDLSNGGKSRLLLDYRLQLDITPTPFWGIVKRGVVVPGVYGLTVRAPANRNGIKAAFTEMVRGLSIVRPDRSCVLNLEAIVSDEHCHKLWTYYNRHDALPADGVAVEIVLSPADIRVISEAFTTTLKVVDGKAVTMLPMKANKGLGLADGELAAIRSGDSLTLRMSLTCSSVVVK